MYLWALALLALITPTVSTSVTGTNFFADPTASYDGYQQAWRYLGWYVECGSPSDRYDEDGGSHQGSHDEDENRWQGNNQCQRNLIWALYVDENYQGGGIGEYQIYDPFKQEWDQTACNTHGNGLCKKMDCHLTSSENFKLMGIFKEASYFGNDAFFEQLFKHLGYCLWNDGDKYEFMSEARESSWTQGCVSTGTYGNSFYYPEGYSRGYLYIDLKPTYNGNMTNGLYIDSNCKVEYEGLDIDVDTIASKMSLLSGNDLTTWNDGLEVFKVCQPCRAYNMQSTSKSNYNYRKLGGNDENYDYGYSNPNKGYFTCNDDAGWTDVNQCMKFRTHAELEVATWEDLVTATNQGGILQINISGTVLGSDRMTSEEWAYVKNQRRNKLAAQAREAAAEAYAVRKLQAPAATWMTWGTLSLAFSSVLVVAVALRAIYNRHLFNLRQQTKQPLLADADVYAEKMPPIS